MQQICYYDYVEDPTDIDLNLLTFTTLEQAKEYTEEGWKPVRITITIEELNEDGTVK